MKLSNILRKNFSNIVLNKNCNQAFELAQYAINFLNHGEPHQKVLQRTKLFNTDSVLCGVSAIALKTNAPHVFRNQAITQRLPNKSKHTAKVLGNKSMVPTSKAILANVAAVREWDSNGTVFGYSSQPGRQAGQFGHNDFYPVVIAAAHQNRNINGSLALKSMVLLDQIRGRLCQVFSLKTYKIDHVVHGAIASIATYGALMQAKPQEIQHAIGMFVAHYIPFRAIRAGKQLSDSKGSSAAISTQAAITCMKRAMAGFIGPKDIFRNPQAIFRYFKNTDGDSPFDIFLSNKGQQFAIMGMHFKLGLYEHQSAGALEGLLKILFQNRITQKYLLEDIQNITIVSYEPAFSIIGDPAKRTPTTRQSADHSMVYIVSTLLRKAFQRKLQNIQNLNQMWKKLMLQPKDYSKIALTNQKTKGLIQKCKFEHGGKQYDSKYPQGIPTSIQLKIKGQTFDSKLILFPSGHCKNEQCDLKNILDHKFKLLGKLGLHEKQVDSFINKIERIQSLSNIQLQDYYDCKIFQTKYSIDSEEFV